MKLAYSTWGMPAVPIDQAIAHIAKLGFDGMELSVAPRYITEMSTLDAGKRRHIADLLHQYNIPLASIHANSSMIERDPKLHAPNMARLKGAVDLAVELAQDGRLPVVCTTPGGKPDQWPELKGLLLERAGELAEYARTRGVTIGIEAHIGAIVEMPDQIVELIESVNAPNFRANFDISHFDVWGLDLEQTIATLAPYAVATHVKDQRGRAPDFEFLIPGEGDFDYVAYLKAMHAHGFDGYITAEISWMVMNKANYDPFAAAETTYRTLDRAFKLAGLPRPVPGT